MSSIKNISFALLMVLTTIMMGHAQNQLNNYKYVIVESQFHFQNEKNEYDLNRLVRFLFRKHGFRVVMEDEPLPEDLKSDYCLALNSEVTARGALRTKAVVVLRNCDNVIVFASEEGITKEKDFARAYDLAIRKAFESFASLEYEYVPEEKSSSEENEVKTSEQVEAQDEIKELKEEIKELKEEKESVKKQSEPIKVEPIKAETKAKIEEPEVVTIDVVEKKTAEASTEKVQYTAVAIDNGFELTDNNGKVKYTIFKTGMDNIFTLKEKKGIIYKKGDAWIREYVKGNKTIYESLSIIF